MRTRWVRPALRLHEESSDLPNVVPLEDRPHGLPVDPVGRGEFPLERRGAVASGEFLLLPRTSRLSMRVRHRGLPQSHTGQSR